MKTCQAGLLEESKSPYEEIGLEKRAGYNLTAQGRLEIPCDRTPSAAGSTSFVEADESDT